MHRIDTPTAQKDKFGAGKNGFTRGNPQTGTSATELDDDYFDALQEEIVGVIEAAAIQLDKSDRGQLLKAMKKHFQASDKTLAALAGLLTGANKLPYFTGNDTVDQTDLTQVGRDIIGKTSTDAVLQYLGLGDAAKLNVGTTAGTVAAGNDARFGLMIGVGQSWVNVTSSRASKTTYTNDTGKPIMVVVSANGSLADANFIVDGVAVALIGYHPSATIVRPVSAIVPAGSTYRVSNTIGSPYMWSELR